MDPIILSSLAAAALGGGALWAGPDFLTRLPGKEAASLSDYLPWRRLVRPDVVTTVEDEFLTVFRFAAADVGTMPQGEIDAVAYRLSAALGALKPKPSVKVQFYARREPVREYLRSAVPAHPVLEAADEERERFFLHEEPVYQTGRYLSLAWRPSDDDLARLRAALAASKLEEAIAIDQAMLAEFEGVLARLQASLGDALETVERLGERVEVDEFGIARRRSDLLSFLHSFVTGSLTPFNVPEEAAIELNGLLASRGFAGRSKHPKIGDDFVLPILLKTFPAETEPLILDELTRLGVPHVFCVRWLPMTLTEAHAALRDIVLDFQGSAKAHGSFVDPGSLKSSIEATEAHGAAKDPYTQFGRSTFVVLVRAKTLAQLQAAKNAVLAVLEKAGFPNAYIPELAAWDAIASTFPGAQRWRGLHKHPEHALSIATIVPLHEHDRGRKFNGSRFRVPNTPPHFYALAPGSALTRVHTSVDDVEHGFGLAPTSWGKSTLQAFLALQRLGRLPFSGQTGFDKGLASYRACMMADGVVYDPLGDRNAPGFALFDRVHEPAEAEEVLKILTEMLVLWGVKPTPDEDQSLRDAMRVIASRPPEYRSMSDFARQVQDDTGRLRDVLQKYTDAGALGNLLDCSSDSFGTRTWTVFDLQHVIEMAPEYLVPVLRVLAWKTASGAAAIRASLGDVGRYYQHMLNIDESHLLQKHPAGEKFILDVQKTGRARGLSVFLWSNGLDEMARTAGRTELLTQAKTRIFGGNPAATDDETRELYRSLGLNERGLAWLPKLEAREFLLHQPEAGILQRLTLRLDGPMLALIGDPRTNSDVDLFRERFPAEKWGLHEWKIRLLEHEGQHAFAARLRAKIVGSRAQETPAAIVSALTPTRVA
ncbi:MAG: hypothetical protein WCE44_14670 [Candidatus Velthaea sp.]